MKTRDLIIICATLIILLCIGIFIISSSNSAETTILSMTNSPSLNEGDSLILKLNNENGTVIPNQKIEINLTDEKGITENFTLKTNSKGECRLEDLPASNFSLFAKYSGNSKYKESTISGKITVKKVSTSSSNNKANNDQFKSDYNVNDVIDGWDPSEHEVSREDVGDGQTRITYDDGYFRIVDKDGNIITYGY